MAELDKLSRDGRLAFNEERHTYTLVETGEKLTSVTTMLSEFKQGFDAKEVSERVVLDEKSTYYGMDAEEVREAWLEKGVMAAGRGTRLHLYAEHMLNGVEDDLEDTRTEFVLEAIQFLEHFGYEVVETEAILYSEDAGIAGQADLILKKDGKLFIGDWKFLGKPVQKKSYFKDGSYEKMKKPFQYLDDCNFNHYNAQLAVYQTLTGRPEDIAGRFLIVVLEDKWEIVNLPSMRVYWDFNGDMQAVYQVWNGKWYASESNRFSENKPKWIQGL